MRLFGFLNRHKPEQNIDTEKETLSDFESEQFEEMKREFKEWGLPNLELKKLDKVKEEIRKGFKEYINEMKPEVKKAYPGSSEEEIVKDIRRHFQYLAIESLVESWKREKSDSEIEAEIKEMKEKVREARKEFRNLSDSEIDRLDKEKYVFLMELKPLMKKGHPNISDEEAFKSALNGLRVTAIEKMIEFWNRKNPDSTSFGELHHVAINGRLRELYFKDDVSNSRNSEIEKSVLVEEFMNIVLEEHWTRRFDKCFEGVMLPSLWTTNMAEYVLHRHRIKYDRV